MNSLKKITLIHDPFSKDGWITKHVEDIHAFLASQFQDFPATARIYHSHIAVANDVTPHDKESIDRLSAMDGEFYCVVYPADLISFGSWVAAKVFGYAVGLLVPKPPNATLRNTSAASPNNELAGRTNSARINGRIPDIFGTVRSTPDLIALPYTLYDNNVEVEHTIMCIGRGTHEIHDFYDGDTRIVDIAGSTVQVYSPNTDIVIGTPSYSVGAAITDEPLSTQKSDSVNGQVMRPSNSNSMGANLDIEFKYPNEIKLTVASSRDFTKVFTSGDVLTIAGANFDVDDDLNGATPDVNVSLDGDYTILAVSAKLITVSSPAAINSNWNLLDNLPSNITPPTNATLASNLPKWIGPFVLESATRQRILANFVALNGIYEDNGKAQFAYWVDVELEITPIDLSDTPIGAPEIATGTLMGSAVSKDTVGITIDYTTSFVGRCSVRARRSSTTDTGFQGSVVDEVKWKDLFGASSLPVTNFGNVTVLRSRTYATAGALSVKERKLNMLVTRKIPRREVDGSMSEVLYASNRASDIMAAISFDPFIGNRPLAQVDLDNIYDTVDEIEAYFGTDEAVNFGYTFDATNLSFEESIGIVASAIFCTPYRLNNVLRLSFERETDDSILLFNHRNKLPNTDKRTQTFGIQNDFDGVEFQYVDPTDDAVVTYYVPVAGSAVSPKKYESQGVRTKVQAHFLAWRMWNKLRHQKVSVEFSSTHEAELLVRQDRILVADNTRTDTQDGEILGQSGLVLDCSQVLIFSPGKTYTVFLQLPDGTVDNIAVTAGTENNQMMLGRAPLEALALDHDLCRRATYMLVANDETRARAFLVAEKTSNSDMTCAVKAGNYDARYYEHDTDFINDLIP